MGIINKPLDVRYHGYNQPKQNNTYERIENKKLNKLNNKSRKVLSEVDVHNNINYETKNEHECNENYYNVVRYERCKMKKSRNENKNKCEQYQPRNRYERSMKNLFINTDKQIEYSNKLNRKRTKNPIQYKTEPEKKTRYVVNTPVDSRHRMNNTQERFSHLIYNQICNVDKLHENNVEKYETKCDHCKLKRLDELITEEQHLKIKHEQDNYRHIKFTKGNEFRPQKIFVTIDKPLTIYDKTLYKNDLIMIENELKDKRDEGLNHDNHKERKFSYGYLNNKFEVGVNEIEKERQNVITLNERFTNKKTVEEIDYELIKLQDENEVDKDDFLDNILDGALSNEIIGQQTINDEIDDNMKIPTDEIHEINNSEIIRHDTKTEELNEFIFSLNDNTSSYFG